MGTPGCGFEPLAGISFFVGIIPFLGRLSIGGGVIQEANDMALPDGYEVRALAPDELDAWWDLRLRSLRDHPDAFGGDYESAIKRGPDYLREGLVPGSVERLFAAFAPDGSLVAQLRTIAETGKRRHIAWIISVATDPDHRGLGLSRALIALAIEHCRAFPEIRQISIGVNAENAVALAVYTGAGFVAWGTEPRAFATEDGFQDEVHMVLILDQEGTGNDNMSDA